jgi:predicted RND superfamily exporter protein
LGDENLKVITAPDLPRGLTTGLREKDGSLGKSLLVYPRPSDALWQAGAIHTFVATLRGLAASDAHEPARAGRVAGSIPLSDDIIASIAHDAPIASAVSFLAVVLVVIVVVRAARASIYVLGSLMLGVLWLGGAVMALHIKINFANFIAFPITFGIGVDYAVNVMNRYVQDGERDISGAVRSTGGAVALCSMTTVIGYSSLLLAKNRALFLFGLVAVTGEAACLTAAIIALPAALVLARNLHERLP